MTHTGRRARPHSLNGLFTFRPDAPAPGFLQLTGSSPVGVVLLRWSPQRRHGVVVVTAGGDRGPIAGQIAALALAGHAGRSSSESQ